MGRGNARFGCPNGTFRVNDHSALHYHAYVPYGDRNSQDEFEFLDQEIRNYIKATCSAYSTFQFPEKKWLDRDMLVIAESPTIGVAVCDNEWSKAIFVYARECDEKEESLDEKVFNLACRLFWDMRYLDLSRRSCAWTSAAYQGIPTST